MTVIGRDDDQGIARVGALHGEFHCAGKFDGVGQCPKGIAEMVRVIDAAAFNHQEVPLLVPRQDVEGLAGHLGQGRLPGAILCPVMLEVHM